MTATTSSSAPTPRTRFHGAARRAFPALAVRNFRLYAFGQTISVSGTWMQSVAQAWLVLKLTDSGLALGLVTATQFIPMLLLGPFGGVVADRVDKRRLLQTTQVISGSFALTLAMLTLTGAVQLWMVFLLAFGLGVTSAFDMPARQSFVFEMVGAGNLTNAVSLNSIVMNAGRLVGPAVAGITIAVVGTGMCFLLNAVSYAATFLALRAMRADELEPVEQAPRARGQLRAGVRYVWSTPALRTPLLLMAAIGTFTYEFQVSLPILAEFTFDAGAGGYSLLLATMSIGAVVGGTVLASRMAPTHRRLGQAAFAFAGAVALAAVMPTLSLTAVVMPLVGATSIVFITQANATLQLTAAPDMRARVIALYGVAFLGSTPVGGPIVGAIGNALGGRVALLVGAAAALTAVALAWRSLDRASDVRVEGALPMDAHAPIDHRDRVRTRRRWSTPEAGAERPSHPEPAPARSEQVAAAA